jgi:hypothetical protein
VFNSATFKAVAKVYVSPTNCPSAPPGLPACEKGFAIAPMRSDAAPRIPQDTRQFAPDHIGSVHRANSPDTVCAASTRAHMGIDHVITAMETFRFAESINGLHGDGLHRPGLLRISCKTSFSPVLLFVISPLIISANSQNQ